MGFSLDPGRVYACLPIHIAVLCWRCGLTVGNTAGRSGFGRRMRGRGRELVLSPWLSLTPCWRRCGAALAMATKSPQLVPARHRSPIQRKRSSRPRGWSAPWSEHSALRVELPSSVLLRRARAAQNLKGSRVARSVGQCGRVVFASCKSVAGARVVERNTLTCQSCGVAQCDRDCRRERKDGGSGLELGSAVHASTSCNDCAEEVTLPASQSRIERENVRATAFAHARRDAGLGPVSKLCGLLARHSSTGN